MSSWKKILRKQFTNWKALAEFLEIDEREILQKPLFPLKLPFRLAQKIKKNDLNDPILRQFLPSIHELKVAPGDKLDPVDDKSFQKTDKLLHKYEDRALLLVTSSCAMHCRFCFRQNFPYETGPSLFEDEMNYIRNNPSLKEIILSGGDPLSVDNSKLESILADLNKIPHIERIRFHTRFPLGVPERIDDSFLNILSSSQKQIFFIIHVNHPQELDDDIFSHLKKIQKLGIPVLSQSVLLKGINDDTRVLKKLFEMLTYSGVIPYYLHRLDPVQGSSQFEVSREQGCALISGLREKIAGFAVPRFVEEIPGKPSKTLII